MDHRAAVMRVLAAYAVSHQMPLAIFALFLAPIIAVSSALYFEKHFA